MKIKFTPSPNQLWIKHLIRNSKKQKFLCDIYISLNRTLSDRIDYPKQFRIRNPIQYSLPITPLDRIFYPKLFRIKNPIRRGFLKKPCRIENPIRIGRRMKSRDLDSIRNSCDVYADIHHPWVQLKSFIQVCWLGSWSMLTYITQWYIWIALSKYVNIIFCSWNPQVCWHTSPNARSYKVCWLASPMCIIYFMDYADLHHPVI